MFVVFEFKNKIYYCLKKYFLKKSKYYILLENFDDLEEACVYLENKLQEKVIINY